MKKRNIITIISFILLTAFTLNFSSCVDSAHAEENLMNNISAGSVTGKIADKKFISAQANFAISVFKKTAEMYQGKNILISPLSLTLALAMTANGADGETKSELEAVLGGELNIDELNEYLYSYKNKITSDKYVKMNLANSIWIRNDPDFKVKTEFLQKNADYYNAAATKSSFDDETVKSINKWVKENTNGMIEKIIDELDPDSMMLLINALTFEGRWEEEYIQENIYEGIFNCTGGNKKNTVMMGAEESKYISTDTAEGIIKPYSRGTFSFAALLPNEGTTVEELIASLSGENFIKTMKSAENFKLYATLPKFTYDSDYKMKDILKGIGINSAFNGGFSGIEEKNSLYVENVIHKTHISLDECGTKAGAVSAVELLRESISIVDHEKEIVFDRPFVYAVIDSNTCMPIFIGALNTID